MVFGETKMKIKLTWKLWLLVLFLIFSLMSIFITPGGISYFQKGVMVTSVELNSTAFEQGLRKGMIITHIDGEKVDSLEEFSKFFEGKFVSGEMVKLTLTTKKAEFVMYDRDAPKITVSEIPKTNIRTGLDLSGGARALVQAEGKQLSSSEVRDLVDVTSNRFNEFGLTDIHVVPVSDLSGNNFMLIEIAGATPNDLEELISKQGKFEAKIGDETVFEGGDRDIASVCRNDATCSGIESCQDYADGSSVCTFRFVIYLTEEAANRHARITGDLGINTSNPQYLSEMLDLYLDDRLVDSLLIGKDLKGRATTQIQISGSGTGISQADAYDTAIEQMHKLQTLLITGSLPFKLEIVKLDTISPTLGKDFIRTIILAGLAAILVVSIIIFVRYRNIKTAMALLLTSFSEVFIILGIASFINWNLDLPSLAGILATVGTGIDQQIIILDESRQKISMSLKQKLKNAFLIILGTYFTALVSLLPLMWAGAGLLKGFAITTLIGITVGVLITRPAFTDIIQKISE